MTSMILAVLAALLISAISLIGILTIHWSKTKVTHLVTFFVPLAAGTMLGSVFFHLLPEAAELIPEASFFPLLLLSFLIFVLIEKAFHWRHCHQEDCSIHPFGYMNILGDGVHNFLDGIVLVTAFLVSIPLGLATTLAVAIHEVPQEIGDFGVLLHAGFTKKKALLLNFGSALLALVGVVVGAVIAEQIQAVVPFFLLFAAGGFLYIAATDLIPEMRKAKDRQSLVLSIVSFLFGIGLMWILEFIPFGLE